MNSNIAPHQCFATGAYTLYLLARNCSLCHICQ